jgi:hypothetical protein
MTSTHQQTPTATAIAGPTRYMTNLAALLVDDIDPAHWASRHGTTINHPAFVLGHCGYYAAICVEMLGGDMETGADEQTLFDHEAQCIDDASIYPDKQRTIDAFNARLAAVADFIESCDESIFARSSEHTPFADRFPTLGGVAAFMLIGHIPFHLGQLSAWRRVAGMGSAT